MCLLVSFFLSSFYFPSSLSTLYKKGEDEICLCQTLDVVKNNHIPTKMFGGGGVGEW